MYPPFEQYQMEHPEMGYDPYSMAYPPFEEAFYGAPQGYADPFAGYVPPQSAGGYPQQPYVDPFAMHEGHPASQQTQLYHFGAFAASVPVYQNTPPQMPYPPAPPVYPAPMPYPPQAPMYPPQGYVPQMPPRDPRMGQRPPQAPRDPRMEQRPPQGPRNPQQGNASLRPRQPQNQDPRQARPAQEKQNAAYPPPSDPTPPEKKDGKKRRGKSSYRKSSVVLICFFSLLCLISLGMLGYLLIPRLVAKGEYISLTPDAVANQDAGFSFDSVTALFETEEPQDSYTLTPELLAYYESVNDDFIGWVDVPGTLIHYPIVRADDNDYYLRHTFKKSYSDYGSIYADYRCADDFSDANTVIYGHNMRNGTMFHDLTQMLGQAYLDDHPTFTITTSDARVLTYQIFSVHEVHITTDYRTISLDDYERPVYFETLHSYTDVTTPEVDFAEDSRIVTFSTCPNDSDDRYRIAVHAILIDEAPLE